MNNRAMESRIMTNMHPRMAEAVCLKAQGRMVAEIAATMGVKRGTVHNYLHQARRLGAMVADGRPGTGNGKLIVLTPRLVAFLRPHARRRGVGVSVLAERILQAVVAPFDGGTLVDAVLDDGEDSDVV